MRRCVRSGLGLLLVGVVALPAAAQRSPESPTVALEEPRPNPIFPASLVPFSIAPQVCRRGHVPRVGMRVYNVFAQPVATLHLRDRRLVALDTVQLRCGQYVGLWDGSVDAGTRAASPGIYYVRLSVDDYPPLAKKVIITPP